MHDDMTETAILTLINDVFYRHIRLC